MQNKKEKLIDSHYFVMFQLRMILLCCHKNVVTFSSFFL